MRLDINYKKKTVRNPNTWRLNNTILNKQQVTEEIKREIKKQMTMKTWQLKPMGGSKSNSKRDVYSKTIRPQETRKTSTRQHNFTPKTTGKRRTTATTKNPLKLV